MKLEVRMKKQPKQVVGAVADALSKQEFWRRAGARIGAVAPEGRLSDHGGNDEPVVEAPASPSCEVDLPAVGNLPKRPIVKLAAPL